MQVTPIVLRESTDVCSFSVWVNASWPRYAISRSFVASVLCAMASV